MGRATNGLCKSCKSRVISIHALRGEGDSPRLSGGARGQHFYPRPPWGGRPWEARVLLGDKKFLSTPSVGRATFAAATTNCTSSLFLSTPSVGRATGRGGADVPYLQFLSTPSVGRATRIGYPLDQYLDIFLSTPSVGRATAAGAAPARGTRISIHALRGEGDYMEPVSGTNGFRFLSTPSVGRATAKVHKNPVQLLRKGYNHFPAGRRNPPRGGKTAASTFNNLAAKC